MKAINKRAAAVMDKLVDGLEFIGDHRKVDNGGAGIMAVCVEFIGQFGLGDVFSVAHYHVQNGDMMQDPEMEFIRAADGRYYPRSFLQAPYRAADDRDA